MRPRSSVPLYGSLLHSCLCWLKNKANLSDPNSCVQVEAFRFKDDQKRADKLAAAAPVRPRSSVPLYGSLLYSCLYWLKNEANLSDPDSCAQVEAFRFKDDQRRAAAAPVRQRSCGPLDKGCPES